MKAFGKAGHAAPTVRRYESGRCMSEEFAKNMVNEFDLAITAAGFIEQFSQSPKRTYPGAQSLLDSLSGKFHLACLSNTNHTIEKGF
jgi:hypothetical protein